MNQGEALKAMNARGLLLERLRQRRPTTTGSGSAVKRIAAASHGAAGTEPAPNHAELSFAQRRLWFLDQWSPGNLGYVIPVMIRLRGQLDPGALDAALRAVVDQHPALRTSFPSRDGSPIQLVHPAVTVPFEWIDLTNLPEPDREPAALRRARAIARIPFDLATGPVVRAAALRIGANEHLMLIAAHHIVSDGWSTGLLLADLATAYARIRAGEPAALPAPQASYLDYARWQRRTLTEDEIQRRCARWARWLLGAPTVLELPADRPRPPVQTFNGATHRFTIGETVTTGLRSLCDAHDATLFMGLLAAFGALLGRYSGRDDLLVGTPVANRGAREYERVVGLFVNTIPLRVDQSGDPTFAESLTRVRRTAIAGYGAADTPFERLVDHLRLARDPARSPLTQVLFAMQYQEREPLIMDGVEMTPAELDTGTTTSDLVLNVKERGGELDGFVEYNSDLFDASTIERMFTNFSVLLEHAVREPRARLSELRSLSPGEERLVVREWNATAVDWPEATIPDLFAERVAATPEAVAVVAGEYQLTYLELDTRAERLARHLASQGVGPGALVGVLLERSDHLMVSLLAIMKAGAAYVPLDPDYPVDRLTFMIADSAATLVLTSTELHGLVSDTATDLVAVDTLPAVDVTGPPLPAATPGDLAYVIYTSGSTGRPKGVRIPHRGVVNHLRWLQETFQLTSADRLIQKTSICFDVSVWELFWPLVTGATLVLAKPGGHRDPSYLGEFIRSERVTVAYFVPSTLRVFLDLVDISTCHDLRLVFCGGEALPVDLANRLLRAAPVRLANIYGPTEASIDATWWDCRPNWTRPTIPIGRPVANTTGYVLDERLRPLPIGVPGELYIGGVQLATGYHDRPELTAERFIDDPFDDRPGARLYRTGDLVRWLADGTLEFLGRDDDQIKLRGLRIELGEIETCLASHPAVSACAVTVHEPTPGDQRLAGHIVPAVAGSPPTPRELRAHLARSLPEYMIPSGYTLLAELPLTANGKTDRRALPAPAARLSEATTAGDAVTGDGVTAAGDPLRLAIAAIWRDALGAPSVSLTESFFDQGGHSLLLVTVHQRLAGVLPREVDLVDLFRYPTIEALAEYCQDAPGAGGDR